MVVKETALEAHVPLRLAHEAQSSFSIKLRSRIRDGKLFLPVHFNRKEAHHAAGVASGRGHYVTLVLSAAL